MQEKSIDEIARELAGGMSLEQLREAQDGGKRLSAEPQPMTDAERAYWDGVYNTPPKTHGSTIAPRVHSPVERLSYDVAKHRAWSFFKARAYELKAIKGDPDFFWKFTDQQREIIANLIRYFVNDPACPYNLNKGILLYGSLGVGKTEIMRILSRWVEAEELPKAFRFTNITEIYDRAAGDKTYDPITGNVQFDRCFDELGFKIGEVNVYGNNVDITETILAQRYDRNRRYGQLTHLITNLDTTGIKNALSSRIFDRLHELCTGIHYPGTSHRTKK